MIADGKPQAYRTVLRRSRAMMRETACRNSSLNLGTLHLRCKVVNYFQPKRTGVVICGLLF